jgi:hypothetical protein
MTQLLTDEAGNFWSNSGAYTDWMQQSMGSLANRTLKHIAMPGSHDAGMGIFNPGTIGAHFANTQTQYLDSTNSSWPDRATSIFALSCQMDSG